MKHAALGTSQKNSHAQVSSQWRTRPRHSLRLDSLHVTLCFAAPLCLFAGCGQNSSRAVDTPDNSLSQAVHSSNNPKGADSDSPPTSNNDDDQTVGSPNTKKHTEYTPPQRADITFDDIKLEMEKDEPFVAEKLTERVEQLHEKPIRIRGYILPSFQQRGITQFVLVRDNLECCFGPGAALHDCILVNMRPGKSAEFTVRPVAVEGVFRVQEFKGPDGKHLAIYQMDGESVK